VAADELSATCAALGLEPTVSQLQQLGSYLDMLQRWNATYNLTAVRDRAGMLRQHLADCLAVVRPLLAQCAQGRVLDVGSGGGLPGVVLAVLAPGLEVTCVDTVGKKAAFIRQVAGQLSLPNLRATHARVEALPATGYQVITSRAFASLADFTALTAQLLAPGGVWMAMKGKRPDEEIAALAGGVSVFHVEQLQVPGLAADRCLVWMRPPT
jgi:16S rRNA (guanine527-N7)-methyltransferase